MTEAKPVSPPTRVLVAEDDPPIRMLLVRSLRSWGLEPVEATTGLEAVERMRAPGAPRVALLDWMLPGKAGVDVCRDIRDLPNGRGVRIILLTARDQYADRVAGLAAGADDYVVKPWDSEDLRLRVMAAARAVTATDRPRGEAGDHKAGDVVGGKYKLVRELGRGGMGAVWQATHKTLDVDVALKFIRTEHLADEKMRARFELEARAASQLQSDAVTRVLDFGTSERGEPYLAMELLRGETLADAITRRGKIPPHEVAAIVMALARGLARAHAVGIVHRDIKPANVFLAEGDDDTVAGLPYVPKLMDFGVARWTAAPIVDGPSTAGSAPDGVTEHGAIVGTPAYMSPEQLRGLTPIGPEADLWSLGVCTFTAITGLRPFDAPTLPELANVISGALPRMRDHDPSLPEELDAWFARACHRVPTERFADARAMGRALVQATGARFLQTEPPPPMQPSMVPIAPPSSIVPGPRSMPTMREGPRHVIAEPEPTPPPQLPPSRVRERVTFALSLVLALLVGAAIALWWAR